MQRFMNPRSTLPPLQRCCAVTLPRPISSKPDGSKMDRMLAQSAKIEAGHVHLPKQADWLDTFLLELLAFPHGRHDDQVDSVSQFLNWAARERYFDDQSGGLGLPMCSDDFETL
jgi:hypothetical protein